MLSWAFTFLIIAIVDVLVSRARRRPAVDGPSIRLDPLETMEKKPKPEIRPGKPESEPSKPKPTTLPTKGPGVGQPDAPARPKVPNPKAGRP